MTTTPRLPDTVKNLFVDFFMLSSELRMKDETIAVLRLLRRSLPRLPDLAVAEAWQLINARELTAARELLEECEQKFKDSATVKAALALCLHQQQDPLWHFYANDAREMPDNADALEILAVIEPEASHA